MFPGRPEPSAGPQLGTFEDQACLVVLLAAARQSSITLAVVACSHLLSPV